MRGADLAEVAELENAGATKHNEQTDGIRPAYLIPLDGPARDAHLRAKLVKARNNPSWLAFIKSYSIWQPTHLADFE